MFVSRQQRFRTFYRTAVAFLKYLFDRTIVSVLSKTNKFKQVTMFVIHCLNSTSPPPDRNKHNGKYGQGTVQKFSNSGIPLRTRNQSRKKYRILHHQCKSKMTCLSDIPSDPHWDFIEFCSRRPLHWFPSVSSPPGVSRAQGLISPWASCT